MTKNPSTDNDEIDLINVFKTSWEGKFSIIFFILIANLFAYSYINMKDPIYESKLSIEIENIPPFLDLKYLYPKLKEIEDTILFH